MLSSRCSLSRCFFCSFSRAFQSGRKECSSARFNEDIRDMSFSPDTKRNAFTENNKSVSDQKFINRTQDHPYFRGTNRVASNLSFANVSSTGAALPIRVVSSSSFSSRVKSVVNGVNIVRKCRENKS